MSARTRPFRGNAWRALGSLLAVLLFCLAVPRATARAGGGGSYGFSGGGSYGGSFHSYGGSSYRGTGHYGMDNYEPGKKIGPGWLNGVVLLIGAAFLVLAWLPQRSLRARIEGKAIRRRKKLGLQFSLEQGLGELRTHDPAFVEGEFLDRVGSAFVRVQEAWCEQDLLPVCHFLSDGVFERFSIQLDEMQQQGRRNIMEGVQVLYSGIAEIDATGTLHTVTVRIHAEAIDYTLDAQGERVAGIMAPARFTEYWSFVRHSEARTKQVGLLEGNCPNCGAALQLNQIAKCESCNALVRNGQYDWVLTEITQESEWQPSPQKQIPGVSSLLETDPAFCVQQLEDAASVMFWRYIRSCRQGTPDSLRPVADDAYCERLGEVLQPDADGSRLLPADAAVGSVETVGVLCEAPTDRALVEIRWSCGQERLGPDGSRLRLGDAEFRRCCFVLARQHGSASNMEHALSSAHCRHCGSPVLQSTANTCEYCHEPMSRGEDSWLLEEIVLRHSPAAAKLFARIRETAAAEQKTSEKEQPPAIVSPPQGSELLAWMIYAMLADGKIDSKEEQLVRAYAQKHGIGDQQLQRLIAAKKAGKLRVDHPRSSEEAQQRLECMARIAFADGFISKEERSVVLGLGAYLGFTDRDVEAVLTTARTQLAALHKGKLRLRRQSV